MQQLFTSFREFVDREQLFTKTDKLLLACSSGLDSTVLAHLLHAEGYNFAIAHMNFQLRGEASDGDAAFVEDLARTLDARFWYKAVDTKRQAQPGESTQMTARRLRYAWFEELRQGQPYTYLLTGHHANDNLETLLINLLRGTGLRGVAGMAPKRDWVCRPLLSISRNTLVEHANTAGITWREDASNNTDDYLRNRIRHQIVPTLTDEFEYSLQRWVATADNLRSDLFLRDYGLKKLEATYVKKLDEFTILNRSQIKSLPVMKALLYELGKRYNFTQEQIRQISVVNGNRQLGSVSHRAYVTEEEIRFIQLGSIILKPLEIVSISQLPVSVPYGLGGSLKLTMRKRPTTLEQPDAYLIAPPTLPLHLRPRKNGDRFQPLGLGGKTKKVKDYLIDQKIPVWLRDQLYLLVNEQDEILAIPGYCVSEKFKVLPEHHEVLQLSWENLPAGREVE